jgi:hypothetical protein
MSDIDRAVEAFGEAWAATPEGVPGDRRRAGLLAAAPFMQGLSDRPEWSEVVESNLRAEVATARRELAEHRLQADLATVMFEGALRLVTEQRDQARRVAVSLEQELAESERKLGLWLGGERAL